MSLSAYDIFTRLDGCGDEESSTASSRIDEIEDNVEDEDHGLVLSSVGSESFDSISLDSAVLQELERSDQRVRPTAWSHADGEQTILSSAPSGTIPAPEASQDLFALTPHPQFVPDGIRSISTTSTEYIRDIASDTLSDMSLSSVNIRGNNYGGGNFPFDLGSASPSNQGHEAVVFERIASQLLGDQSTSSLSQAFSSQWYDRLISETDWDHFRVAAKAILNILDPKPSERLLPLPPPPPNMKVRTSSTSHVSYCAQDHLPSDFICGLCKDVVVGACTLDCGCNSALVCASCFEQGNEGFEETKPEKSDNMGFVWIEDAVKECPLCHGNVNTKVHCHALDVAILHIIRDLPESDEKLESLKQNYYSRLAAWRATVYDRNETRNKQITDQHDELLSRLIQEEERIFWNSREKDQSEHNYILFLGQAAVALVAATIASIGLRVMMRR